MIKALIRSLHFLVLVCAVFINSSTTFANSSRPESQANSVGQCEHLFHSRPQTLNELTAKAQARQVQLQARLPHRTYVDPLVDRTRVEDGILGPKVLSEFHPARHRFQEAQSPNAETAASLKLDEPGPSIALRVTTNHNGQRIRTTTYTTLPRSILDFKSDSAKRPFQKQYLIGAEYIQTGAIVHLHGGGTPTAEGVNAKSIGESPEVFNRGIPVMGVTMPGHGSAELYPFKNGLEQLEFLFQLIKDNVHPDVPITISGHSWGGQFAIQIHLLWPMLQKFGVNVVGLLALSPPPDLSLGGSAADQKAMEQKVDGCMDDWKDRVAPADYDFINNIVRNGKTSPVAALYCTLSQLDYKWSIPRDNIHRPRLQVIVGQGDGLVYTGREEVFNQFLKELLPPEDYILMSPGRDFSSGKDSEEKLVGRVIVGTLENDEIKTTGNVLNVFKPAERAELKMIGHNIFDRYMDRQDREKMRDFLGADVDKENLYEVYTRIAYFVSQQIGRKLEKSSPRTSGMSTVQDALDRIYRHWSNNLAFREFTESYVFRKVVELPAQAKLVQRKLELSPYLGLITKSEKQATDAVDSEIQQKLKTLSAQYGVSSIGQAKKELPLSLTPVRKAELLDFIEKADPIRKRIHAENPDRSHEEILALKTRPQDIRSLEEAQNLLDSNSIKDPKRLRELQTFVTDAKKIVKESKRALGQKMGDAMKLELTFPEGVFTVADAQWELNLNSSPERKAQLQEYLKAAHLVESQRDQLVQAKVQELLSQVPRPPGLAKPEDAKTELNKIQNILDRKYIPEDGPNASKVAHILKRLDELRDLKRNMDEELYSKKDGLVRKIDNLKIKRKGHSNNLQTLMGTAQKPAELVRLIEEREKVLEKFIEANRAYDQNVSSKLTDLEDRGLLTNEAVDRLFYELGPFVRRYNEMRSLFLRAKAKVEEVSLRLALQGNLGPEIQGEAQILFGQKGQSGLEMEIQKLSETRERLLKTIAEFEAEKFALEKKYFELVPGYYTVEQQSLSELLNLTYAQLLARAQDPEKGRLVLETLSKAVLDFEDMYSGRDKLEKRGVDLN